MPVEQVVLFVAVAALALALVVVLVAPRLRGGSHGDLRVRTPRAGRHGSPTLDEVHAEPRKPQPASLAGAPTPPPPPPASMVCPTCRRQYAVGLRFCPYDARVLTPDAQGAGAVLGERVATDSTANSGKICPSCARRYDAVAMVCGRDGSALVSVN